MRIKATESVPELIESTDISEEEPLGDVEEPASAQTQANKAEKKWTTMKVIVWVCLGNGLAWVWCSYILAALGREQIAESLSQVALTEIIGVVLVYAVKSVFENLSKNNSWPDKPGSGNSTDGVG